MNREIGPLSRSALVELAASGFLATGALVRQGTGGDWIPSGEVAGLFGRKPSPDSVEEPEPARVEPVSAEDPVSLGDRSVSPGQARQQPPSKAQASRDSWYCEVLGERTGPLSSAQLRELAASGFLTPDVPVRKGIEGNWVPASRVRGLFVEASAAKQEVPSPQAEPPSRPPTGNDLRAKREKSSAKPARPPAGETVWYYRPTDEVIGPLASGDLQELAKAGLLTPDVPVRMGTDGEWLRAGQVLGLFDGLAKVAQPKKAKRPAGPVPSKPAAPNDPDGFLDDSLMVPLPDKPIPRAAARRAPKAPVVPLADAAPKQPARPSSTPAIHPAPPQARQPAPASGMAGFLNEALAEPTPDTSKSPDVYDTLPAPPTLPTPVPSAAPDPAAFESRNLNIGSRYEFDKKRPMVEKGSIAGGLVLMIAAALWFFGGLAVGYIFFYPPILFFIGLAVLFKGLFKAVSGGE
jgi:hypothetical protein